MIKKQIQTISCIHCKHHTVKRQCTHLTPTFSNGIYTFCYKLQIYKIFHFCNKHTKLLPDMNNLMSTQICWTFLFTHKITFPSLEDFFHWYFLAHCLVRFPHPLAAKVFHTSAQQSMFNAWCCRGPVAASNRWIVVLWTGTAISVVFVMSAFSGLVALLIVPMIPSTKTTHYKWDFQKPGSSKDQPQKT